MRDLSETLLAAQKTLSIPALVKVYLTRALPEPAQTPRTYEQDRILSIKFTQSPYSQKAEVVLDNSDDALTDIDLKAFQGVISFSTTTSAEYDAQPPLWVIGQTFNSSPNALTCTLDLIGIPDRMALDKADADYIPDDTDTKTVKDLIDAICGDTTRGITFLAPFNQCQPYTVDWESEDDVIDSHMPKSRFKVFTGNSRLTKMRELLEKTGCQMLVKADGYIYIFVPKRDTSTEWEANTAYSLNDMVIPTAANNYSYICTTAGTSAATQPTWPTTIGATVSNGITLVWTVAYDYEYELAVDGQHTFFAKAYRQKLVIPNKVTVKSFTEDTNQFSHSETSEPSHTLMPIEDTVRFTLADEDDAEHIAKAMIARYEMWADAGFAEVPLNLGAEALDFVHVIDSRNGDNRNGNIGQLTLFYTSPTKGKGRWSMTFSFGNLKTLKQILESLGAGVGDLTTYIQNLMVENLYATYIYAEQIECIYLSALTAHMGLLNAGEIRIGTGDINADGGTATGGTQTTLIDSSKTWTVNEWIGQEVRILIDPASELAAYPYYSSLVTGNTATTLTFLALPTGVDVDSGDDYGVGGGTFTGFRIWPQWDYTQGAYIGLMAGYNAGDIQYYAGSDGRLYAGDATFSGATAAGITMDVNGLKIKRVSAGSGQFLKLYYGDTYIGYIAPYAGSLYIVANEGNDLRLSGDSITLYSNTQPINDNAYYLGSITKQFKGAYLGSRLKIPVGTDKFD